MTDHDRESDPLRIAAHSLYDDLTGRLGFSAMGGAITSIGIGGQDGKPALIVYVNRKRDLAKIPATWEGFPVVAEAIGKVRLCGAGGNE